MEKGNLGVADLAEEVTDRQPDKLAVVFVNDGSKLTFRQLDEGEPPQHAVC
jgi:hypothetical protein